MPPWLPAIGSSYASVPSRSPLIHMTTQRGNEANRMKNCMNSEKRQTHLLICVAAGPHFIVAASSAAVVVDIPVFSVAIAAVYMQSQVKSKKTMSTSMHT